MPMPIYCRVAKADRAGLCQYAVMMSQHNAINAVIAVVSKHYGLTREDVRSKRRSRQVHQARCVGMYLAFKAGMDGSAIGRTFGGQDRNIVLAVCRGMASRESSDDRLATVLAGLRRLLGPGAGTEFVSAPALE